jgi:hypothetical protein
MQVSGTWDSPPSPKLLPSYEETQKKALTQLQSPLNVPTRSKYNLEILCYIDFETILRIEDSTSSSSSDLKGGFECYVIGSN